MVVVVYCVMRVGSCSELSFESTIDSGEVSGTEEEVD